MPSPWSVLGGIPGPPNGPAGGDLSGTYPDPTVAKLNGVAAGEFIRRTGVVPFTADQSMGGKKLTSVADPTLAQDAATKNYIDIKKRTLFSWNGTAAAGNTNTNFVGVGSANAPTTTERNGQVLIAVGGTVSDMYVSHSVAMAADSITYTMRLNGVDTGLGVTMGAGVTANSNLANSFATSAGDKLGVKSIQSSTEANASLAPRVAVAKTS